MMQAVLVAALLPPLVAGYLLVTALWPDPRGGLPAVLIRLCLAVGIGFGLSSGVFFAGLVIAGPSLIGVIVGDVVLLGVAGLWFALRRRPPAAANAAFAPLARRAIRQFYMKGLKSVAVDLTPDLTRSSALDLSPLQFGEGEGELPEGSSEGGEVDPSLAEPHWPGRDVLQWLSLILAAAAGVGFITISGIEPHGQWDARAIWNLNARFIYRGGDHWANLFTTTLTIPHPDYPLLLPATIARLWTAAGRDLTLAPVMVAGLYLAALFGLLTAGLWALKGRSQGLLAGLILVTSPRLIAQSTYQYADLPLSFTILAAMVLIALWHEHEHSPHGLAVLSGIITGLGAWTKNEGLLFLVIVVGVVLLSGLIRKSPARRSIVMFLAGLLPVAAVIVLFKTVYAPPNDIISAQGWDITWARLTDPSRYMLTIRAFITEGLRVGSGGPILLAGYLLLVGVRLEDRQTTIIMLTTILALTLLGYFFIYIITPLDLQTHLDYSIDRLIMHLWPGVLFVFFLVVPSPGEALQK